MSYCRFLKASNECEVNSLESRKRPLFPRAINKLHSGCLPPRIDDPSSPSTRNLPYAAIETIKRTPVYIPTQRLLRTRRLKQSMHTNDYQYFPRPQQFNKALNNVQRNHKDKHKRQQSKGISIQKFNIIQSKLTAIEDSLKRNRRIKSKRLLEGNCRMKALELSERRFRIGRGKKLTIDTDRDFIDYSLERDSTPLMKRIINAKAIQFN